MNDLKRFLIVGSSGGLGHAISRELHGPEVELSLHCFKNRTSSENLAKELRQNNRTPQVLQFDVSSFEETRQVLEDDVEANGAYYGIIYNCGITRDGMIPNLEKEDWHSVIDTNLNGFYHVVKPLVMPMIRNKKGGRILAITSISGLIGNMGQANYSASKAGIVGAVKSLAIELGKRKITVNAIAPGLIETEMIQDLPLDEIKKSIPLKRIGRPEEVASLVGFLASEKASYITRQVISINGGMI